MEDGLTFQGELRLLSRYKYESFINSLGDLVT